VVSWTLSVPALSRTTARSNCCLGHKSCQQIKFLNSDMLQCHISALPRRSNIHPDQGRRSLISSTRSSLNAYLIHNLHNIRQLHTAPTTGSTTHRLLCKDPISLTLRSNMVGRSTRLLHRLQQPPRSLTVRRRGEYKSTWLSRPMHLRGYILFVPLAA